MITRRHHRSASAAVRIRFMENMKYVSIAFVGLLLFFFLAGDTAQHLDESDKPRVEEFCQWEFFNVSCRPNEFILITSARYGRMNVGRCVPVDYFTGCSIDVQPQLETRCAGRRECAVAISDRVLFRAQPCRKDLVAYLEAGYRCVAVSGLTSSAPMPTCDRGAIRVRDLSGYFASHVTSQTGLGSERCPWLIEAKAGQRIQISLREFSDRSHPFLLQRFPPPSDGDAQKEQDTDVREEGGTHDCPVVAEFYEDASSVQSVRSCTGNPASYASVTNHLYVNILPSPASNNSSSSRGDHHFYLHYEVFGCPDVMPPLNAWLTRDGDRLLVVCNFTKEKWHIVCNGREWISSIYNCSSSVAAVGFNTNKELRQRQTNSFPFGLLVAVAVGVVIGIAIGFLFLLLICFCRSRWKERLKYRDPNRDVYKLMELRSQPEIEYSRAATLKPDANCACLVSDGKVSSVETGRRIYEWNINTMKNDTRSSCNIGPDAMRSDDYDFLKSRDVKERETVWCDCFGKPTQVVYSGLRLPGSCTCSSERYIRARSMIVSPGHVPPGDETQQTVTVIEPCSFNQKNGVLSAKRDAPEIDENR